MSDKPLKKLSLISPRGDKKEKDKEKKKEKDKEGDKKEKKDKEGDKKEKEGDKKEKDKEGDKKEKDKEGDKKEKKEKKEKGDKEETVKSPRKKKGNKYNTHIDISILPPVWTEETFNETQWEKIKTFRENVKDYIKSDIGDLDLARWLVARKWDINASTNMYVNGMKWREKENIDNALEWVPQQKNFKFLSEYWPLSILPSQNAPRLRTFDGCQLIYERLASMSSHLLQVVSKEDLLQFHYYIQELTANERKEIFLEEKEGKEFSSAVFIQDLSGLSMSQLSGPFYHLIHVFSECDANYYPETLRRVYFINVPSIFNVGWKIAKKVIDPCTLEKVVVLGSNFQEELRKVIPPECLPIEYGGDLDYLPKGGGSLKDLIAQAQPPKMAKLDISHSFSVTIQAQKGQSIGWQFRTKSYDISFAIDYQETEDGERVPLHEAKRVESHKSTIEGIENAEKTGYYTLVWDNSYSWARGKHLKYLIFLDGAVIDEKDIVSQVKK